MKKVLVGISGGVDSAMSLVLLKKKGYEVAGIYFDMLGNDLGKKNAEKICKFLKIKFYSKDLIKEFREDVINDFLRVYSLGETPNPCVQCNKKIKFKHLLNASNELGYEFISTGHYVRLKDNFLYKAKDLSKDQSYFLYDLDKEILKKIIFPLGDYYKKDIKKMAEDLNIPIKGGESFDICFIANGIGEFLKKEIKLVPGKIVDINGAIVGEHLGLPLYTIGQRENLLVNQGKLTITKDKHKLSPVYVIGKDLDKNQLVVGYKENLYKNGLIAKDVNLFDNINYLKTYDAKIRYGKSQDKCIIKKERDKIFVKFNNSQFGITSGQSVVWYEGDRLIGGGIIERVYEE